MVIIMSVRDTLREIGCWIQEREFEKRVAHDMEVSERQAYRKIKKAYDKKEIMKIPLTNGKVLYGLQEFGLKGIFDRLDYSSLTEEEKEKLWFEYVWLSKVYKYQAFCLSHFNDFGSMHMSEEYEDFFKDF